MQVYKNGGKMLNLWGKVDKESVNKFRVPLAEKQPLKLILKTACPPLKQVDDVW